MPEAHGDKADNGHAEGEVFHALYRIGVVQGNVQHPGYIAGQQGRGYGHIEEYRDNGRLQIAGKGANQQIHRKSDEKVGDFVSVELHIHGITSLYQLNLRMARRHFVLIDVIFRDEGGVFLLAKQDFYDRAANFAKVAVSCTCLHFSLD